MSIGTPVLIVVDSTIRNSGSPSAATTVDAPAGSLVVISIAARTAGTVSAISDSAGNNYTRAWHQVGSGSHDIDLWYCSNIIHLPVGSTFTATVGTSPAQYLIFGAAAVSGANGGLDWRAGASTASGSNFGTGIQTGTLGVQGEIIFGVLNFDSLSTYTEDSGFTKLTNPPSQGPFSYQLLPGTQGPVGWSPSWTPGQHIDGAIATFRPTPAANTPIVVGINTTANSSTLTTTADIPPNSLVIVTLVPASGANTVSTLTDGHGNTYTQAGSGSGGSFPTFIWYSSATPNDIPAGSTFTATGTDPSNTLILSIAYVQGYNGGLDKTNGAQTGTGVTTFSLNTGGTLTQASEIVFGAWHPYSGVTSYTEGSGFTYLVNDVFANAGLSYQVVNSTAQVTWSPTYGPATQASTFIATFKATAFPVTAGWELPPLTLPTRRRIAGAIRSESNIEAQLPGFSSTIVRSNQVHSGVPNAAKYYFEVTITAASPVGQVGVGIDNGVESISNQAAIGAICWCGDGSVNYNGNLAVYNAGPFNVSDTLGVAVDFVNNRIWFRDGAGNWNNSATANPATNTGGFDWSGIGNTGIFAIQQVIASSTLTPNYTGPFANAAPTNFGPWQAFTGSGWQEIETFPVRSVASRANALFGRTQFALIPTPFSPDGWSVQDPQPPHPRPERGMGALAHGDDSNYFPIIIPYKNGFESIFAQPPHPRPEKGSAFLRGDDGTEAKFLFVPFVPSFGSYATFWSDPPHPAPEKRFAAIAPFDDTSYLPATRLLRYGWEVLPWQPPHPRPEKSGATAPWDITIAAPFIAPLVTLGPGWEIQPWQPPHPRIETRGVALIIGDNGVYLPFVFIPPPVPNPGGSGDLPIHLLPDYIPRPPYKQKPNKPFRPIWDRGKIPEGEPEKPSGPPPLPPLDIFGTKAPARIISMQGLPTFQEYAPENPLAMQQHLEQAMDESDALAALRAIGLLKDK
jgi:hypothetical protein